MSVKMIIDEHYTKYYHYYHMICTRFFKGRYIAEDMLHELYLGFLTVKSEVIIKFHAIDKLKCIGIRILKSLYSKRNLGTKRAGKTTSPLHELPMVFDVNELEIETDNISNEYNYEKTEQAINKLTSNNDTWFVTQVFIQCQQTNISKLSRETKISRSYLTAAYKKGRELLHKEVTT